MAADVDEPAPAGESDGETLGDAMRALGIDVERCPGGVPVAAVGPDTARAATYRGLESDLVAGSRLADLVRAIENLTGHERGGRREGLRHRQGAA